MTRTKLHDIDPEAALRSQIAFWVATHPDDSKATSTAGFAKAYGRGVPYADIKRLFDEAHARQPAEETRGRSVIARSI